MSDDGPSKERSHLIAPDDWQSVEGREASIDEPPETEGRARFAKRAKGGLLRKLRRIQLEDPNIYPLY